METTDDESVLSEQEGGGVSMKRSRLSSRITSLLLLMLAFVVLAPSTSGCLRNKKTDPGYGGSEWIDDWRDRIRKGVDDPDKVTELLLVVDKMEATLIDLDRDLVDYYETLSKLDRDYSTTRDEFEKAMKQFSVTRETHFEALLEHSYEMRKIAGREYWEVISDIDATLYEQWRESPVETSMSGGSR